MRKSQPQLVATIGSADAGKTVYLGMLTDMLSRASDDLQLLARGAFSVSLQQMTMSALANCEFPDKTPNEPDRWNWIHCQVRLSKKRNPTELIMPDLSGEAILEEVDHPHTYPVIRAFLTKCAGVLILVDAVRLMEGEKDQDFFAMKMLTYLCELDDDPKKGWPSRPISIIFTKADQCETCFDDAVGIRPQACSRPVAALQSAICPHLFLCRGSGRRLRLPDGIGWAAPGAAAGRAAWRCRSVSLDGPTDRPVSVVPVSRPGVQWQTAANGASPPVKGEWCVRRAGDLHLRAQRSKRRISGRRGEPWRDAGRQA